MRLSTSLTHAVEKFTDSAAKNYFEIRDGRYMGLQGKPFVWQFEFPELFFDDDGKDRKQPGFDVVIGNPPHGADLTEEERTVIEKCYELGTKYKNTAFLFIERCYHALASSGKLGLVIPKSLTFSQMWQKVRHYLLVNLQLKEIADISKAFSGVLLEQIVMIASKDAPSKSFTGIYLDENGPSEKTTISASLCLEMATFPTHADLNCLKIYEKIKTKSLGQRFGWITETCLGYPLQGKVMKKESKATEAVLRGDEIKPYLIMAPSCFIKKSELAQDVEKYKTLRKPKILSQNIVADVIHPKDHIVIMAAVDEHGTFNLDTVMNTVVIDDAFPIHYLNAIMNSKITSWFTYIFIYNKAIRTMHFDEYYINKIPVLRATEHNMKSLVSASKQLHKLVPQLAGIDVDFRHYVANYPRVKDRKLTNYYYPLLHGAKKTIMNSALTGTVTDLFTKIDGEWITVFANYERDGIRVEKAEIVSLKITDPDIRHFVCASVNWAQKKRTTGNILSAVLATPIPHFSENPAKNLEVVCHIGKEYSGAVQEYRRISSEISKLEDQINQTIYKLYDLDLNEISMVENMFDRGSVILSLFQQPKDLA
jgi:hypothetical protein